MPETESIAASHPASSVEVMPGGPVHGSIRPPGSKSLTNRALICAAMASGPSRLSGALASEDTEVMIQALRSIGVAVEVSEGGRTLLVNAATQRPGVSSMATRATHQPIELFVANSGTSIRFLTAALSALGGHYRLHGVPRMHERPIGDLVDAIRDVIAGEIHTESPGKCPPVLIDSQGWSGRQLEVSGSVSSQFLSGLMMAAPIAGQTNPDLKETRISVNGELVSRPYVDMTAEVMRSFAAVVDVAEVYSLSQETQPVDPTNVECLVVSVAAKPYQGANYAIEPDASAASYFWATAAITGGTVTVEGLTKDAIQGDVGFCEVLQQMGCEVRYGDESITVSGNALRGVDVDMNMISDTVQTLAVVALFAQGATRVRGVAHNRFKETDRIGDLACELRKLGAVIDEHEDGLTIQADHASLGGATLETYHDHRMAMSLALAGLRIEGVRILDPACTTKTYPEFFADLERLIGRPHKWRAE